MNVPQFLEDLIVRRVEFHSAVAAEMNLWKPVKVTARSGTSKHLSADGSVRDGDWWVLRDERS